MAIGTIYLVEVENNLVKVGCSLQPSLRRIQLWGKSVRAIVYLIKVNSKEELMSYESSILTAFDRPSRIREVITASLVEAEHQADAILNSSILEKCAVDPTLKTSGRPKIGYPMPITLTPAQRHWLVSITNEYDRSFAKTIRAILDQYISEHPQGPFCK